jgi:tRNA threonylcarbamoyladenosine biosynthesis protein TsaB
LHVSYSHRQLRCRPLSRYREEIMKILAFETSGLLGSVALLEAVDGRLTSTIERNTPPEQRTARSLLPTAQALLQENGWRPADVDLVAVTTGPGSFTGLRIGVVAAKTFAYAVGAKLVGVHTLAAMAEPIDARAPRLWTILDAQRQELFAASFNPTRSVVGQSDPTTDITPIDDWLAQLSAGDQVAGPPLAKLRQVLPAGVSIADERLWNPTAAAVGRLGIALFNRGREVSPLELVPDYFRKSAAEEKAEATRAT